MGNIKIEKLRMKRLIKLSSILFIAGFLFFWGTGLTGQEKLDYQKPPQEIVDLVDACSTNYVNISPDKKTLLIYECPGLITIKELSQPELRLAGVRINTTINGRSRSYNYHKLKFKNLKNKKVISVTGLPNGYRVLNLFWSPNGQKLAFTLIRDKGIQLWVADIKDGKVKKLTESVINTTLYGRVFQWLGNDKKILYRSIPEKRGQLHDKNLAPKGPNIQVNLGRKAPVRTYQDLLKDARDEKLFTYYTSSQLKLIDITDGSIKKIGSSGVISNFSISPDGKYILVDKIKKPFSYIVPYYKFPTSVEVWDISGALVKKIADLPLADDIPKGLAACQKGPRSFSWRADKGAILSWVEALDGGDPSIQAEFRDQIFFLPAPFNGNKLKGPKLKLRFNKINWGNGKIAMVYGYWWKNRRVRTQLFQPDALDVKPEVIFDRSWEDRYSDPGSFLLTVDTSGNRVLLIEKNKNGQEYLFLRGNGSSPEGDRPFLDRFNLQNKKSFRLWRSHSPNYEYVVSVINLKNNQVLTRRESKIKQPNYFIRNLKTKGIKQVTNFPHPYPVLKDVTKQFITYQRADGVNLSGDLYLPGGYKKGDGLLPVLIWAYPREYKKKDAAGQVSGSPFRFIALRPTSHLLWVTQGFAVLNRASMPIVGEGNNEPNDTFVQQLVANGKAAIDKLVKMGIADPDRIAVGGHSYGAFMTANLLAHSRLFAAGVARSGAYNRTLTPFGFQAEERTYWEAPEIYFKMSPFMHAQKVKDPILLIHGEMDNNSGTFPLQSRRYYHALKGHGATVRLVMLPLESHGYRARESVLHMLWETYQWLDKYVKNKK